MNTRADSAKIRQLRASKGWSQEDFARRAKVGESTIQRAEGNKSVRPSTLATLADTLGVTLPEISAESLPSSTQATQHRAYSRPRRLGKYGSLLAAVCDTARDVLHWRRAFADTFTYKGFFMRRHDLPVYAQLEAIAHLAATVSMSLHRDVSEAVNALKRMQKEIDGVGGGLRGHANTGYRLSPEAQAEILKGGTYTCDNADFHLKRAEAELRALLGLEGAA